MAEKYIPYKLNGETYDIPESKSSEFEKNYPSATIEMHMDGQVFDVPLSKKEDAIKRYGSKLTYSFDEGAFETKEEASEPEPVVEPEPAVKTEEPEDEDRTSLGETILKGIGAAGVRTGKMALDLARAGWENSVIGGAINLAKGRKFDEKLQDQDRTLTRWSNALGETADRLSREADPTGGEQGFVDLLSEGKVGKAFQKALGSGIESLPMMVAAASTPAAIVYGLGMAASKYSDDAQDSPEIASWKRGINALGSSALELAVERIGGPLKNIFGKGGGELTEEVAKEILENVAKEGTESIAKRILGGLKKIGKEGLEEGGEEVLTSFGNDALGQALDWIDGNKDYGITAQWQQMKEQNPETDMGDFAKSKAKEYLDSFIGGALSGMQISGTVDSVNAIANSEAPARNELKKMNEYGASLDYGDMYDTDGAVSNSIDNVESALSGSSISRGFLESLSSEDAFALSRGENLTRDQRIAFADLAGAKATQEGLEQKLDKRLEDDINAARSRIADATEGLDVITGTHNGRTVYVKGGSVDNKGGVHVDSKGTDGPVIVIDSATGQTYTANSNEITSVSLLDAETLGNDIEATLREAERQNREIARNTMSPTAKTEAVKPFVGKKMMVDLGNGLIEVEVQQVLPQSREVIIKGKKGDLGGQSFITIGAGTFYDSISRDNEGNPMFVDGSQTTEETPVEEGVPEETAPVSQPEEIDFRGETVSIIINGVPVNVEVISQDGPSNTIVYEYEDENGNIKRGSSTIDAFKNAIQQAAANVPEEVPAAEETPTAEEPAAPVEEVPLAPEDINWDELFEQDPEAYFTELQKQFGDGAIDILNGEIDAAQKEIDALNKNRGNTMNERMNNLRAVSALRLRLGILNEMVERLTPASVTTVETPQPESQQPVAEETPTEPEVPVDETQTEETPTQTTNEQGFIIEDGFVINPVVLEMPGAEGTPNRIFIAENDGKWGFNQHAVLDDGNESGSANAKIQVENIRYNSKEEAIAAALSYFDFYKNLKKNSPSTAIDAFTQYIRETYLGQTPAETDAAPEPAPVESAKPVAPTQVDNPIREAQKREKSLATQLKRLGIPHEQKQDLAFNAGKAIADMFATREEYDAYAENATDFGEYNADFERGVDESFANRQQNISETPVNSVPLESEPNGEDNGEQSETQGPAGDGQGISDNGGRTTDEGAEGGNKTAPKVSKGKARKGEKVADKYPARKGNATQKILVDTFGFSQVTIPNSRKDILNSIYDFMMGMSKMLGISPKSIGQGGWLGVSNLRANSSANARYQMRYSINGVKETNLNLKYGKLSSIAHEWWHALDHTLVFFESGKGTATITEVRESAFDGRKETLDAVRKVMQAIKDSGHMDRMRKLPYFPQSYINYLLEPTELGARAFNEYILMKFAEAGIVVEGVVEEDYPTHPTPEEMAVIAPALDNLFKVLKEKEGKIPGTSVLYHIGDEMDGNDEVKQELGMLVADWIQQGGNFVVMDSAEMQQALADEGISQEAKRPRRTIFNKDLSSAEKQRIQKYILSLPKEYAKDRPYLLMTRNYAYVFNTLPSRYEENTTQKPIGDGFEILHKVNIRALPAAERNELERRYNNDEERRAINEWLQAAGDVIRGLPVSVSDSSDTGTGAGYDSMADTEHREEARANGADNSSLRNTGEVQKLETPDGVIFGFVKNGVVYLDPTLINPNTSIHEYTHLWDNALMQLNPTLWERGKALMKQTPIWDEVVNDPNYADIKDNEDLVASEVHSRLVGKDGAELLSQLEQQTREEGLTKGAKNLSVLGRLREWLKEATQWLKDAFTSVWSKEEIEAVTLTDFLNMPLRDLANFTELSNAKLDRTQYSFSSENSVSLQNYEYTGETYADNDSRGGESEVEGIQGEASVSGPLSEGRRLARPENGKVSQYAHTRFNPISKREGESDRQRNNREARFIASFEKLTSDEKILLYNFLSEYLPESSGILKSKADVFLEPIKSKGNTAFAKFVEDFINDELKYREGVSASAVAKHGIFVGVKQNLSVIERMFYAFNNDEYNGVLFDRVFNLAKRFGVSVKFATRKEDGSFFTGYGNYNPNENTITLDANLLVKGNEAELCQTILHELIHSVVARAASIMSGRAVDNNKQFIDPKSLPQDVVDGINILKEVYESIKDDGTFQDTYGKKDFEEMLSEISHPKFRALLKAKKLWKKFLNGICQILGIADTSASESDALTEIESALDKILSSAERGELDSAYASYLGQLAEGYTLEDLNRLESGPVKTMLTQNVLYRTGIDPTEMAHESAKQVYDKVVNDTWQEFQRQFQDAMQPVRIAIDAIQQETGNIPIEDYENYILVQNQASSRSRVEIDDFARRYYSPIIEQVNRMIDIILEARHYDKHDKTKRAEVYAEIRQYMIAKHGLERNEYYQTHKMRRLTATEQRRETDEAKRIYDDEVNNINADASLTDAERELALRNALDAFDAAITEIKTREVPDVRDYSGLTALFGLEPKKFEEAEQEARKLVDDFEASIAGIDADAVNDLWARINKATDKTLRHSYESGMLSRQQYNDIKAMFQFYIPLRGFDETTAEDVYSYARFEGNRFNPAVQTAQGRTSVADDPIAIIMNMAESEIAQGNKNRAKQALYNFILNRAQGRMSQNSLMQIENVWYVETVDAYGNITYTIAAPDHDAGETYEEFENRMQALASMDKAYKSTKGKVDIGMRFQKQMNRNAHYVYLKVNGVDKAIYINGDPKAADAINGSYRPKPMFGEGKMRDINRFVSSTFTNYSLEFTARNFFRDLVYSHINIDIKEKDPAYRKKFRQNWRHNNVVRVWTMLKAYRAGEYDGVPLNEDQAAFVEFMMNGGQTGYTVINSVESHKKELERAIKNIQKGIEKGGVKDSTIFKYTLGSIEFLNEVSEIVTRFAAYKTSRDMGRGVATAINNAKEITVNFNTKGAQDGRGIMGWIAQYFGWSKFFFNASVQGVQNIGAMAKANKLKFCSTVGGVIAAGFLVPVITSIINALFGDDEEEYWNIPEYDRQNNLCIVVGDRYAKIPLPIGFREVYAIGDMVAAMAFDKKFSRDVKQVGTDMANKISSIVLPINPLESSANGLSFWHTALYTALPSVSQFAIQNVSNVDWKGTPLQKEYTYNENDPQWMKAFASNPDWMVGLSKWCNEHINLDGDYTGLDWSPEKLDNTLSNVFGGIYSLIKKTGRSISMIWNKEQRNLSNVPLAGVVVGSGVGEDDRFITDAYFEMKEYYDNNIGKIKRTAGAFGLSLDDVFVNQDGTHHPKMQEIYSNKNFDFMQEWYLGDDELQKKKNKVKNLEKKINSQDEPSLMDVEELAILKSEYDVERRDFVNDMLELD